MSRGRLRILLVIIDLHGGAGVFCRNLTTGLKCHFAEEFEVSLLVCREGGLLPDDGRLFDRIEVLHVPIDGTWTRSLQTLAHLRRLRQAIGRTPADVILSVGTFANLLVPAAAAGRTCIGTVHSNPTELLRSSRFRHILSPLLHWRYARMLLVGPSRGVVEDLQRSFDAPRVELIPHGVDLDRIRMLADEPAPSDLPPRPYIVSCGRLSAAKDYPTLLRAYAGARHRGVNEDLLIIGEGEDRPLLEKQAGHLGLIGSVHLIGHRPNPFPYLKHARLFVLSSIWEGFGLALVEAMALGLPCIATDCPSGPAEILEGGRSGLLVPLRNPAAMADAIFRLACSDTLRTQLSTQSVHRANDFSLETMARRYRDLLWRESDR